MAPLLRPPHSSCTTTRLTQHLHHAHAPQPQLLSTFLLSSQRTLQSNPSAPSRTRHQIKTLHTTPLRPSSHDSPYDPPTGNLWGVPAGQTYQKEGWENVWIYGFFGSLLFGVVGYAFKSDSSIETWALEEAKRRLQAEGILPEEDQEGEQAR